VIKGDTSGQTAFSLLATKAAFNFSSDSETQPPPVGLRGVATVPSLLLPLPLIGSETRERRADPTFGQILEEIARWAERL
jgi:hypothetical protein